MRAKLAIKSLLKFRSSLQPHFLEGQHVVPRRSGNRVVSRRCDRCRFCHCDCHYHYHYHCHCRRRRWLGNHMVKIIALLMSHDVSGGSSGGVI